MKQSISYIPLLLGLCSLAIGGLLWKSGVLAPPASKQSSTPIAKATPLEPVTLLPVPPAIAATPLNVAINPDKSGSIEPGHAVMLTIKHLQPLADAVAQRGGEIAVGTICSTSGQALTRQRITEPPTLDTNSPHDSTLPVPVDDRLNAFRRREAELIYAQAMADHQRISAENKAVVADHEAIVATHHQQASSQLTAYLETLQPTLEAPATCWETDLYGALARSSSFLNENPKSWNTPPVKFLIVISDGLDTAGTPSVSLDDDITLLVVGTQTEESIFQDYDHLAFENIQAAISYVVAAVEEN